MRPPPSPRSIRAIGYGVVFPIAAYGIRSEGPGIASNDGCS